MSTNSVKKNQPDSQGLESTVTELSERISYVIHSTETAALATLDGVERAEDRIRTFSSSHPEKVASDPEVKELLDSLKVELRDIAQRQEYQDLCSQVLEYALRLLENNAHDDALSVAKGNTTETNDGESVAVCGPDYRANVSQDEYVTDQDEIDAIMNKFSQ